MGRSTDQVVLEAKDARSALATARQDHYDEREPGSTSGEGSVVFDLATLNTFENFLPNGGDAETDIDLIVPLTKDFSTRERTVVVTLRGDTYVDAKRYGALSLARAAGLNRVISAEIVKEPRLPKPTVIVTEGELRRVYDVYAGPGYRASIGFDTVAEARADAVNLVASGKHTGASVRGRIIRESEDILTVTQSTPETVKVTLRVTEEIPAKGASVNEYAVIYWVNN